MTEMTIASIEALAASFAFSRLAGQALRSDVSIRDKPVIRICYSDQSRIQGPMADWCSNGLNVEEHSAGNFQHCLVDDILIGPETGVSGAQGQIARDLYSLYAKFQFSEALGDLVNDLELDRLSSLPRRHHPAQWVRARRGVGTADVPGRDGRCYESVELGTVVCVV